MIAVISLGHYIYFQQFEGLREDLIRKSGEFKQYIDPEKVDILDAGYIDCAEDAFSAVKRLKQEDPDLLFIILSTYVPSAVCAPVARYLNIPQVLVAIQPLEHLDYAHTTTYMQLVNDDVCAMPEIAGEDEDAAIYRVTVYITRELPMYGLLLVPHGIQKAPLVIAQHGGGGTPELCSDLNGQNNYNHMVRRILKRGACVFAPQLLLWNFKDQIPTQPIHPITHDRFAVDNDLKRFGISITAIEIRGIMNAITYLSGLVFIDENNIAMTGLSYGGYFTLHTMAADTRIKVGYSNACFNDRNAYPWQSWSYHNSGNLFHDTEVAALCAPRKLYIAVGKEDVVFRYQSAIPEAERARRYFDTCGCPKNFVFSVWEGGHTVSPEDDGFDFMFSAFE